MLAYLFDTGDGGVKDQVRAAQLYLKAAGRGEAVAQYRLGLLYAQGAGVPLDYKKAEELWQKAADQGLEPARTQLANWHGEGEQECDKSQTKMQTEIAQMLPLKRGLWKLDENATGGNVIENPERKKSCARSTTVCIKELVNLPKGQTWPKGKDDDNDGCIMTISSDTAQFQDIRAQCLLMDIQKKSTKYSDEKYQLEITLRTKNLLAPMVVTPPMEAVVQVNASFIGACSD